MVRSSKRVSSILAVPKGPMPRLGSAAHLRIILQAEGGVDQDFKVNSIVFDTQRQLCLHQTMFVCVYGLCSKKFVLTRYSQCWSGFACHCRKHC